MKIYFFYRIFAKIRVPTRLPHSPPRAMAASAPDSLELESEPASQTEELEREIADTVAAVARKASKRLRSKMLDEGEEAGVALKRAKTNARQERYRKGLREKVQTLRAALATETARADAAEKRADVAEAKLKELDDELLPDDAPGAPGYAGEEPMDG